MSAVLACKAPSASGWTRARNGIPRDLGLSGLFSAAFCVLLWLHGPSNIEQVQHSFPAARLFHESLWQGTFLFWSNSFGLGTPLPLGENLFLHPLFLFEPWVSLKWILRVFWWSHLAIGCFFSIRVCRLLGSKPWPARLAGFSFAFSVASVNYSYIDDWPSVFLGWSLLPIVIFSISRSLMAVSTRERWRYLGVLSLVLAFALYNSHWGYLVSQVVPVVVFSLIAVGKRPRHLMELAGAGALSLLLASERILFVWSELRRFPSTLEPVTHGPISWSAWLGQTVLPFGRDFLRDVSTAGLGDALGGLLRTSPDVRVPFFGLLFTITAIWGIARLAFASHWRSTRMLEKAAILAFATAVVASTLSPEIHLQLPSGVWLTRDSAILFGLITASLVLSRWSAGRFPRGVLQIGVPVGMLQILLFLLPAMLSVRAQKGPGLQFYEAPREQEFEEWVRVRTEGEASRIYLSPGTAYHLMSEAPRFADLGLFGTGDLARYGLLPVNGYFKNVSMDALHPSFKRLGGVVRSSSAVISVPTTFDALAVEYLLALEGEKGLEISHLEPTGPGLWTRLERSLLLYRNPDALAPANLYPAQAAMLDLIPRADCDHPGVLCSDFEPLITQRLGVEVRAAIGNDRVELHFEAQDQPTLLVVSTLHRPQWAALDPEGESLLVLPIAGSLLGVEVPPGVGSVRLNYRPVARIVLATLGIGGCFVVLALIALPPRSREFENDPA